MLELSRQIKQKLFGKGLAQEDFDKELLDYEDEKLTLELLSMQGLTLTKKSDRFFALVLDQSIKDQIFCIVDIETNGSKKSRDQVIEIGAVKIQNKKIIDTFDTLIHTTELPNAIASLTGISLKDLKKAPSLKSVMHDFKLFLGDAIFIAHALKFDYEFISAMFERTGFGKMLNPGLCTIDLAERTFSSAKYGLKYLNQTLNLESNFQQHRAFSDAKITAKVFWYSLDKLPKSVKSVKDLIVFSKETKRMPKAPLIEFEV